MPVDNAFWVWPLFIIKTAGHVEVFVSWHQHASRVAIKPAVRVLRPAAVSAASCSLLPSSHHLHLSSPVVFVCLLTMGSAQRSPRLIVFLLHFLSSAAFRCLKAVKSLWQMYCFHGVHLFESLHFLKYTRRREKLLLGPVWNVGSRKCVKL